MKKMWKKMAAAFVFAAVLIQGTAAVRADVIWEPDDEFYQEERWEMGKEDEFELNNRSYFANGKSGYIYVTDNPEEEKITDALENGSVLFVSFTYENSHGEDWGVIQYRREENGEVTPDYGGDPEDSSIKTGWVLMNELSLVYDSEEFKKEHQEEIKENTEEIHLSPDGEQEVQFWSYPGSGDIIGSSSYEIGKMTFSEIYEAPDGEQWGYAAYHYGMKDFWVCISRPYAVDLPVTAPDPEEIIAPSKAPDPLPETMDTTGSGIHEKKQTTGSKAAMTAAVLGLVVVAVASSVGIIVFIRKKREEENGTD